MSFHCPATLASAIIPSGSAYTMPARTANVPQAPQRTPLDQTSTAPSDLPERAPVTEVQDDRQHDVDEGDDAGRGVVKLLDRLVVDQERQRGHALGADEQDDAELVDREEQAEAPAGEERRKRRRQDDLADDAEEAGAEAGGDLDLRRLDQRECSQERAHHE